MNVGNAKKELKPVFDELGGGSVVLSGMDTTYKNCVIVLGDPDVLDCVEVQVVGLKKHDIVGFAFNAAKVAGGMILMERSKK